ncbi:MAG: alanine--tRNA ligase [Cellvibrionaceae bacterium]|nr:alanine--tRNA ligase [Cellvibrionaceae bacterium]
MNSAALREAFLRFFESKDHTRVASSSLVPTNDPTLLFTNAGMVQFKDTFLGVDKRSYSRAVTAQRCVRAGGKHNDLENVGYTARHHTFFEMLGNFSFGDYFKREGILYAWEFLTSPQWLAIAPEKLVVTVYDDDDEAYDIWCREVGVPAERVIRIGDNKGGKYQSDNFWAMGDTGPCGPCTEIFYDHGDAIWGGLPGSPEEDGDRFIEIWNIVFMQFNRDSSGVMTPLPRPSVDTGMGLERIAAVMQGVHSNYQIDLFQKLLAAVAKVTAAEDSEHKSLRVIADHIRSCAFLIADGVIPTNEGRGYVLRRIIRRAVRHGNHLGQTQAFFHRLVAALLAEMGDAYPELHTHQQHIEKVLLAEEQQFEKTLEKGMAVLHRELAALATKTLPGALVFTLHDTYGFPVDLTNDIAREQGLTLDMDGYRAAMAQQRARARAAGQFKVDDIEQIAPSGDTCFLGYDGLEVEGVITGLYKEGQAVDRLSEGDAAVVVVSHTAFYAESGGQVGDTGYLRVGDTCFEVSDCQKKGHHHLHIGRLIQGALAINDSCVTEVDGRLRQTVARNHSATHLLHAVLRERLGEHVTQKGSLVDAEKLRFDFSHTEALTSAELKAVEERVNSEIRRNTAVSTELCSVAEARSKGAMMLFGEKYTEQVRVLTMGEGYSIELCGGTHVKRTGDIGAFRIVAEAGISAGVRRIEAVTGHRAMEVFDALNRQVQQAAHMLKASPADLLEKLSQLIAQTKTQEKQLLALQAKLASAASDDLLRHVKEVAGVKVLTQQLAGANASHLRDMADALKSQLDSGVFLLAAVEGQKVSLLAGVTKNLSDRYKAGDLMRMVAPLVKGKGGGRPDLAQGGGTYPEGLASAFEAVNTWIAGKRSK